MGRNIAYPGTFGEVDSKCRYAHSERELGLIDAHERMGNPETVSRVGNHASVGVVAQTTLPKASPY